MCVFGGRNKGRNGESSEKWWVFLKNFSDAVSRMPNGESGVVFDAVASFLQARHLPSNTHFPLLLALLLFVLLVHCVPQEEEEEERKGRACLLQRQLHSAGSALDLVRLRCVCERFMCLLLSTLGHLRLSRRLPTQTGVCFIFLFALLVCLLVSERVHV